jgi:hypothetical protein
MNKKEMKELYKRKITKMKIEETKKKNKNL